MEGIVEENGTADPLAPSPDPQSPIVSVGVSNSQSHLMTATNIVQLTLPSHTQAQVGVCPPLRAWSCPVRDESRFLTVQLAGAECHTAQPTVSDTDRRQHTAHAGQGQRHTGQQAELGDTDDAGEPQRTTDIAS